MGSETNPLAPTPSFNPESLEKLLAALSPDSRVCLKAHFEKIDGRVKPPLGQQGGVREAGGRAVAGELVNPGLGEGGQVRGEVRVAGLGLGAGVEGAGESWVLPIGASAVACRRKKSKEALVKKAEEERLKEEVRRREEMEAAAVAKKLKDEEIRKAEEKKKKIEEKETATNELPVESVRPSRLRNKRRGGATPRQQVANLTDLNVEIGQGLLTEIRRLQELLCERDATLENLRTEKSDLEEHVYVLETRIRSLEESERRLQEENRDLGSVVGELRFSEQWDTETQPRVHAAQHMNEKTIDLGKLEDNKASNEGQADEKLQEKVTEQVCTSVIPLENLDDWKALNEKRFADLEVENAKRESEFATMARIFVAGEDKRLALEKRIEILEWDLCRRPRPTGY